MGKKKRDILKFKSNLEKKAYQIIQEIFKKTLYRIKLHYYIPDIELEVDIAIPDLMLAFEIQGEQHRDPDHFFHKNKRWGFQEQKDRDKYLREMLETNGWTLIELWEEDLEVEIVKEKIFSKFE